MNLWDKWYNRILTALTESESNTDFAFVMGIITIISIKTAHD